MLKAGQDAALVWKNYVRGDYSQLDVEMAISVGLADVKTKCNFMYLRRS